MSGGHRKKNMKREKLLSLSVSTQWVKSKTWGWNPHTTVKVIYINKNGVTRYESAEGKASGCGYDKESASIDQAFRKLEPINYFFKKAIKKDVKKGQPLAYGTYKDGSYHFGGCGFSTIRTFLIKKIGLVMISNNNYNYCFINKAELKKNSNIESLF